MTELGLNVTPDSCHSCVLLSSTGTSALLAFRLLRVQPGGCVQFLLFATDAVAPKNCYSTGPVQESIPPPGRRQ
ncbi:hypothetical protein Cfor_10241 [Coptotermes formosanus]|jgi:hypothetical protein|uniref:Uncharacterized protein n=1 Tax=Coptotermes formosanus TaxID=36987 RepID=A0A6L2PH59_COPFO|nr:hypothetical protein Cfor_10241 [Coptotermes formosanus]